MSGSSKEGAAQAYVVSGFSRTGRVSALAGPALERGSAIESHEGDGAKTYRPGEILRDETNQQ
jgi:hypothetical protein